VAHEVEGGVEAYQGRVRALGHVMDHSQAQGLALTDFRIVQVQDFDRHLCSPWMEGVLGANDLCECPSPYCTNKAVPGQH
jgi:hypothetical protein